jgi:hypothetical protein
MKSQIPSNRLIFWTIIFIAAALTVVMIGSVSLYQIQSQQVQATLAAVPTMTAEALEFHYQKGVGYLNIQRWPEAQTEFELIFEIDPNYKDVQERLKQIYAELAVSNPTLTPIATRPQATLPAGDKPALADDLVAYYPFNGNANDESGQGHDGQVSGATLAPDRFGQANQAYHFNGHGDYIQLPLDASQFTGDFTLAAWVNFNNFNNDYPHIFCGENYYLILSGMGPIYQKLKGHIGFYQQSGLHSNPMPPRIAQINSLRPLETNQWHLVIVVKSGQQFYLYINEVLHVEHTAEHNIPLSGDSLYIGANIPGGGLRSGFIEGLVDDIRIYNRALDQAEVKAIYLIE